MEGELDISTPEGESKVEGVVLEAFEDSSAVALSTQTVSETVGVDSGDVRPILETLAEQGELQKVDLEGEYVAWERPKDTFVGHETDELYRISDVKTGLVTRADSRTTALRRLADRIDCLENESHVGAQILGICEAAISPGYFDGVEDVLERCVRPDNRRLYVYVEDDGVTEIRTPAELGREQTIRGFTVTGVFDEAEFDDVMIISAEEAIEASRLTHDHFPLGVFKVTAVHPDHQQQGIGTALASHALAYLAQDPPVVTILWKREDESNEKIVDNFGGEELAVFEGVNPLGNRCPECGFGDECSCINILCGWGIEDVNN